MSPLAGLTGDMMKSMIKVIVAGGIGVASTQTLADDDRRVASQLDTPRALERLSFDGSATALAQLDDADRWRIDATVWLWTMGIEGDVGAFGLTKSINASFVDILEASDSVIGLSGRLEISKGNVAGFTEGLYTKLGVEDVAVGPMDIDLNANIDFDIDLGSGPFNPNPNPNPNPDLDLGVLPGEVDVTFELVVVDFGLMYRLGAWASDDSAAHARHLTLDGYAGARSTSLSVEIDPQGRAADRDRDWIDPIVGLKSEIPVGDHWQLSVWGDVGGFGAASELTWSATGVVGFDFRMFDLPATIYGGYRAIGYDFSEGSGADEFVWEVTLHGPLLGFRIVF